MMRSPPRTVEVLSLMVDEQWEASKAMHEAPMPINQRIMYKGMNKSIGRSALDGA